jgi:predicted nuclease with RNAse H fold
MSLSLGIDFAAQNKKTAACFINWERGQAVAQKPVFGNAGEGVDWIVGLAAKAECVGIDAPFGWPAAIIEALPTWASGGRWPAVDKDDLRYRRTDQAVRRATNRSPLSVSSDRIAVTAWRCARLLDALRPGERAIDRLGADGVFEVYPGAALTQWGFTRAGYKISGNADAKKKQRKARVALVATFEERVPWLDLSDAKTACEDSDDALDALVASLVARAAACDLTIKPRIEGDADARRLAAEGWIHIPQKASLDQLLGRGIRHTFSPPS